MSHLPAPVRPTCTPHLPQKQLHNRLVSCAREVGLPCSVNVLRQEQPASHNVVVSQFIRSPTSSATNSLPSVSPASVSLVSGSKPPPSECCGGCGGWMGSEVGVLYGQLVGRGRVGGWMAILGGGENIFDGMSEGENGGWSVGSGGKVPR